MTLPPAKAVVYREGLEAFYNKFVGDASVPLHELDQLSGRLSFVTRLCRWGKAALGCVYAALSGTGHIRRRERKGRLAAVDAAFWESDAPFWLDFLRAVEDGQFPGVSQWQVAPDEREMRLLAHHKPQTDASGSWGAGGVWDYESYARRWGEVEKDWHISWKELQAICWAVERWAADWAGQRVLVETDNTAAMAYVNRGGGRVPGGREIMRRIMRVCLLHQIDLRAVHIPGVLNVPADLQSRGKGKPTTSDYMFRRYESYNSPPHQVDAACSHDGLNRQPGTELWFSAGANSFLEHWADAAGLRIWCNPPFELIGEFMEAVHRAWLLNPKTSCTMVVPDWNTASWHRWALQRRDSVWRTVDRISGSEPLYWRNVAHNLRFSPGRPHTEAPPPGWDTLVLAFP
jgi:hypothetical protein